MTTLFRHSGLFVIGKSKQASRSSRCDTREPLPGSRATDTADFEMAGLADQQRVRCGRFGKSDGFRALVTTDCSQILRRKARFLSIFFFGRGAKREFFFFFFFFFLKYKI